MRMSNLTDEQLTKLAEMYNMIASEIAPLLNELVDRRAAERSELRSLEGGLAYNYAYSLIESSCPGAQSDRDEDQGFYDISVRDAAAEDVPDAIKYLDARGLLEHHPDRSSWVLLRDESEATA